MARPGRMHAASLALAAASAVLLLPQHGAEAAERTNVLVILTDDQRAEGTLGAMPVTREWLVRGGTRFSSAWTTTPLCCPSRTSILTGLYAHNHGVLFNQGGALLDERLTVAHRLHAAGYRTAIVGRYMNNWPLERDPSGFDEFRITTGGYRDTRWNLNGRLATVERYSTAYTGEAGARFILGQEREDARPWFLYVAPSAPHATFTPGGRVVFQPQRRFARAPVGPFRDNPATREADLSDKPPFLRELVDDTSALPPGTLPGPRATRAGQLRLLISVDGMVSRLRDALRRTGELQDTLVLFTSDNGLLWGEHGALLVKDLPYPPAARIPLLVSWPGHVARGRIDRRLAANIDLAPTILDAAGLERAARTLDGRSLLRSGWRRERLLLEYFGLGETIPPWAGIVTPTVQYTEYRDPQGNVSFRELYDRRRDPWQLQNPLGDAEPGNDPPVEPYADLLHRDMACAGRSCP